MRLTLRTLLAWVDELLRPDEAGELAAKVAASQVAPRLVDRIGDVVANAGMSAPPPNGRGLADDPNTAAEYLDNVLDPERLEAFERVCIESDAHLADVAGCHRILAETVREPAVVESFEPVRRQAALEAARKMLRDAAAPAAAVSVDTTATRPRVLPPEASGRRRRARLAAWLSAAAAIMLVAALGGLLGWMLIRPRGTTSSAPAAQVAMQADAGPQSAPPPADDPAVDQVAAAPAAPPAAPAADPDVAPVTEPATVAVPVVDQVPPPANPASPPSGEATADAPEVAPASDAPASDAPGAPSERSVPFGDALAIGGGIAAPPQPAADRPDLVPQPAAAPQSRQPDVAVVEATVLARPATPDGQWRAATAPGPLDATEEPLEIVAPAWSHPVVAIRGTTIRLLPGSRATVSTGARGVPRVELRFGRVVLVGGAELKVDVAAGGLRGIVAGPPGRPVGIEVAAAPPSASDPAAARLVATIHAVGGATSWRQAAADGGGPPLIGIPTELLIPQSGALRWDGRDPAAAAVVTAAEPKWTQGVGVVDRPLRYAARDLAAALSAAPETPSPEVLRTRLAAERAEDRMAAAATLASLGDARGVADLLAAELPAGLRDGQWLTLEAETVPAVLARGGDEADALLEALRERAAAGCGAELADLARGLDAAMPAEDRATRLIDDLESPSLAVRRYAILRLRQLVPDARLHGDDYRADRPAALRGDSVAWWRERVSRASRGAETPPPAVPSGGDDE